MARQRRPTPTANEHQDVPDLPGAPSGTPTVIAQSWHRSRRAGVDPDSACLPRLQYVDDLDLQRRLVQCAAPVLDRLHDDLAGMPLSIALTDEHAQVMLRRDNDPLLAARLDGAHFAPGFNYAEDVIGTNGVGTALETGMAVYIHGPQHFHESIRAFTCAGAPIHNPLTGRLEGLLDISCLAKDAHPLMRQLALGAARDIEAALRATGSAKQQLVLAAFVAACRRRHVAVYSLSCGIFMSNSYGARLLDPADEAYLREEAHCLLTPSRLGNFDLTLPSGHTIAVKRTLVHDGGEVAGVVLEVERIAGTTAAVSPQRTAPTLPGSSGTSPQWTRCRTEIAALATANTNTVVRGEPGSGRLTLARGAHLHKNPQARLTVVDCAAAEDLDDAMSTALNSSATTVVLRHADRMPGPQADTVARFLAGDQHTYPARWIVATTADTEVLTQSALAQCFTAVVDVPALRHHSDDIPTLARMHLEQLAPHRKLDIDPDALRTLQRYSWPGNVTELVDSLRYALQQRISGTIVTADLPPAVHSAPRRLMTPLENAERDAIVTALRECGGNRLKAAARLGIARSSLYRKIDTYGIHG
ncbi:MULTISPECIES: sigma-54-dependent Fis family transcriptional regulator [unclassified Rhodococcus (in: high G+C Gram-positive bacteria)]|uniref:sigma-54-dependent Fis family transcriptional regulator n=1 Tax=unclassified Rhodococcus (in: high G+C Gram-positive bacteria) TaxID=192944 RepID=UPI000A044469|nr:MULTISPECIES: helix-turn-helix domain-containing protein [unclassified Rhodococcus (in: high G+C Gram-positive bacteria)]